MAQAIDLLGGKTDAERELEAMRGPKVADRIEDDPRLQASRPADPEHGVEAANAAGSYEGFLRKFGAPPPGPNGDGG